MEGGKNLNWHKNMSRDGAVVRVLASHGCDPSQFLPSFIRGLSLLLVHALTL